MTPTLYADKGEVTVAPQKATYIYGAFNVQIPEGKKLAEQDYRFKDAYIYQPKTARNAGRFDLSFRRADVIINAEAEYSAFEHTIDTATKEAAEGIYFERQITTYDGGRYAPGRDYDVGSAVEVIIPSLGAVPSIVSSIEVGVDAQGSGVSVHVGGQPIAEPNERERTNAELVAQRTAERKRRVRELEQAQARAESTTRELLAPVDNRLSHVESKLSTTDAVTKSLTYARRDLEQASKLTPDIERTVKALQAELERTPDNVVAQGASLSLGLNVVNLRISAAHQEAMEGLAAQQIKLESQSSDLWRQQRRLKTAQDDLAQVQKKIVHQQPEVLYCGGNSSAKGGKGSVSTTRRNVTASFSSGYYGTIAIAVQAYATKNFTFFRSRRGYSLKAGTANAGERIGSVLVFFFPENEPK